MTLIDLFIILMVISAVFRGRDLGLVRQIGSTAGFVVGLLAGVKLQPYTANLVEGSTERALVAMMTILASAFICLSIGEYTGIKLKNKFTHQGLNTADGWLGGVIGSATLLLAVWLGAAIIGSMPFPSAQNAIQQSAVISRLNAVLPSTTTVIANLSNLIDPNSFPRVFSGNEPALRGNTTVPGIGAELQAAIDQTKGSVVKLEGLGCGGIVEGSGFVIDSDLVVTNAHVLAGVREPFVRDAFGQHTARAIWFDPELDFAIVRVNNLAGGPLLMNYDIVEDGTQAAVIGFPGGGAQTAGGAQVIDHFDARGYDIYNRDSSLRSVYALAAKVIPGNSGGPLIAADGSVIGVIFAQSTNQEDVGYALSTRQLASAISQATAQNREVSTGACAQS